MSHHKHTATLFHDGRTFDVHVIEMKQNFIDGPAMFQFKASQITEIVKPFPDFVAKRQELIDFAKTGAPPVEPYGFTSEPPALSVVDALREREAAFNEDQPVDASQVPEPRTFYARAVPRMKEQKPWEETKAALLEHAGRMFSERVRVVEPSWPRDETIIITNLRCHRHGSYSGSPGNIACPYCPKPRPKSLNDFAREVHASNSHWWHDPATGEKLDRNMGELLMLVVSEIAECMEGERKNLMDDHLPLRKMAEVELADAVIRIADIAGAFDCGIEKHGSEDWVKFQLESMCDNKAEYLLYICGFMTYFHESEDAPVKFGLAMALGCIEAYAQKHGYDLWGAVAEKREYNKHRADHKPEARLAANGKKW